MFPRLVASGIPLALHQDGVHITAHNPWFAMHYATTGRNNILTTTNPQGDLINPGQQISRQQALHMYTRGASWYLNREDDLGSIEEGKLADLVVLDKDYFRVSDADMRTIRPILTVVDGKVVYDTGELNDRGHNTTTMTTMTTTAVAMETGPSDENHPQTPHRGAARSARAAGARQRPDHDRDDDDRDTRKVKRAEALALVNGRIHTMDAKNRVVSEVLIENGRFVEVGRRVDRSGRVKVIDLRGRPSSRAYRRAQPIVLVGNRPGWHIGMEHVFIIADALAEYRARAGLDRAGAGRVRHHHRPDLGDPVPENRLPTCDEMNSISRRARSTSRRRRAAAG